MLDVRKCGTCLWKGVPEALVLIRKWGRIRQESYCGTRSASDSRLSSLTLISRQCKSRPLIGNMMLSICLRQSRERG